MSTTLEIYFFLKRIRDNASAYPGIPLLVDAFQCAMDHVAKEFSKEDEAYMDAMNARIERGAKVAKVYWDRVFKP